MRASRGEAGGGACLVGPRQLQGLPSWTSLWNSHSGDSARAFCLGGDKSLDAATLRRGGTLSEAAPVRRTPAGCCHCRFYQQHLKRMLEHVPWTGTLAPAPGPTWRRLTLLADVLGAAPPALMGHPSGDSEWEEIASPLQQVLGPSSVLSSMTHLAPSVQVPPHICDFAGHPPVSPLGTQCSREHLRNTSGVRVPSRPSTLSLVNTCVTSSSDSLSQWVEQLCRTASWMQQLLCRSQPRAAICPRPPTSFLRPPPTARSGVTLPLSFAATQQASLSPAWTPTRGHPCGLREHTQAPYCPAPHSALPLLPWPTPCTVLGGHGGCWAT